MPSRFQTLFKQKAAKETKGKTGTAILQSRVCETGEANVAKDGRIASVGSGSPVRKPSEQAAKLRRPTREARPETSKPLRRVGVPPARLFQGNTSPSRIKASDE